ncbi:MAG: hypothetical protein JO329_27665 [Planctomycetaceae bacterium]|nr:hypothetical protein [Planctomycetaceae bacterium]
MALKTSLRLIAKRIANAVKAYASNEGLPRGEYDLIRTYDNKNDQISLTFGTVRDIDERRWYAGILQEIRRSFPEYPQMTMFIGLVIREVRNPDEIYTNALVGEDEIDLTELFDRFLDERS